MLESMQRSQWTDTAWSRDEEGFGYTLAGWERATDANSLPGLANCGGGVDGLTGLQTPQDNKRPRVCVGTNASAAPCSSALHRSHGSPCRRHPNPARRWCYIFCLPKCRQFASRCCRAYAPNEALFGHWNLGFLPLNLYDESPKADRRSVLCHISSATFFTVFSIEFLSVCC